MTEQIDGLSYVKLRSKLDADNHFNLSPSNLSKYHLGRSIADRVDALNDPADDAEDVFPYREIGAYLEGLLS